MLVHWISPIGYLMSSPSLTCVSHTSLLPSRTSDMIQSRTVESEGNEIFLPGSPVIEETQVISGIDPLIMTTMIVPSSSQSHKTTSNVRFPAIKKSSVPSVCSSVKATISMLSTPRFSHWDASVKLLSTSISNTGLAVLPTLISVYNVTNELTTIKSITSETAFQTSSSMNTIFYHTTTMETSDLTIVEFPRTSSLSLHQSSSPNTQSLPLHPKDEHDSNYHDIAFASGAMVCAVFILVSAILVLAVSGVCLQFRKKKVQRKDDKRSSWADRRSDSFRFTSYE